MFYRTFRVFQEQRNANIISSCRESEASVDFKYYVIVAKKLDFALADLEGVVSGIPLTA